MNDKFKESARYVIISENEGCLLIKDRQENKFAGLKNTPGAQNAVKEQCFEPEITWHSKQQIEKKLESIIREHSLKKWMVIMAEEQLKKMRE